MRPDDLLPDERAALSTPLGFLRNEHAALASHFNAFLQTGLSTSAINRSTGACGQWYWRLLEWDTRYFGHPVVRIEAAGWDEREGDPADCLAAELAGLLDELERMHGRLYVFADLAAEDTEPIQAMGRCGFKLVETRLTYYTTDPGAPAERNQQLVRAATADDIPHLRSVAARARNPFDRYHADRHFGNEVADRYLATYAENSVRGLADAVLLPDPGDGAPAGAFLTLDVTIPPECPLGLEHECSLGLATGRIVLVAVGPERRGWHARLLAAATRFFAEKGVDVAYMTTQATNRAVIRNCERAGYGFGRASHVLALSREAGV